MVEKSAGQLVHKLQNRWIYFCARTIVILLFAGLLFFPQELEFFLKTPFVLGILLFGTIVMAVILFGDLLTTRQKSIGSLMYKYIFLTFSVILTYGLFYYINATILDPPGILFIDGHEMALESAVFYFSGVNYFTIGYGDIIPVGGISQAAAISEAFISNVINLIVLATAFQRWVSKNKE